MDSDNQILSLGYNGNIRGQCGDLCGGDSCLRDTQNIPSGTETDIGCVHAEENAILNCARQGVSCKGSTLYVNGEPCAKCAHRIARQHKDHAFTYIYTHTNPRGPWRWAGLGESSDGKSHKTAISAKIDYIPHLGLG